MTLDMTIAHRQRGEEEDMGEEGGHRANYHRITPLAALRSLHWAEN